MHFLDEEGKVSYLVEYPEKKKNFPRENLYEFSIYVFTPMLYIYFTCIYLGYVYCVVKITFI